jgi:uncharacterized membrane protein
VKKLSQKSFSYIVIGLGIIGFLASLTLSYEKYQSALDPNHVPSCSLSPFLDCGKVLESGTDNLLLKIPNAYFGLAAFGALMAVGVMLLAGAHVKDWFWKAFYGGTVFGLIMVGFFFYQSLYNIGALCLYCMVTWLAVIPLFVYSTIWMIESKLLKIPAKFDRAWSVIRKNHLSIVVLIYGMIYIAIAFKFDDSTWIRYLWVEN